MIGKVNKKFLSSFLTLIILIGVYSKNRVEWNTLDMGCALYGYTLIPLYDTLGSETISYIFG